VIENRVSYRPRFGLHLKLNEENQMNKFESYPKRLMWLIALLLTAFITGCGGGNVTSVAPASNAKAIIAFSLNGVTGTINEAAKTIAVTVPFGTNVTALVATFTTTGASVKVGATAQASTITPNSFAGPDLHSHGG
jgi:hypothetical protein